MRCVCCPLPAASQGLKLDGMDGLTSELLAAVDEAEKSSGRGLDADNDKGWQVGSVMLLLLVGCVHGVVCVGGWVVGGNGVEGA